MTFILIAHRGFSSAAPENTLAAFDLALESGFGHIELDAQLTADGVPVVIHDPNVDRTTDGSGVVAEAALADLVKLDAGSWFPNAFERGYVGQRIPTLDEVLNRYKGRAHLYLELKSEHPDLPATVADLLKRRGWLGVAANDPHTAPGITMISTHLEQLGRSQELLPEVRHGWIVWRLDGADVRLARRLGLQGISPEVSWLTVASVVEARSAGLAVGVWGLKSPTDLARAVQLGAMGATVDWPTAAREFLATMERE